MAVGEALSYLERHGWELYKDLEDGTFVMRSPGGRLNILHSQAVLKIWNSCKTKDRLSERILEVLSSNGPTSVYDLSEKVGMDISVTRQFTDRMTKQRLIVSYGVYDADKGRKITYYRQEEETNE